MASNRLAQFRVFGKKIVAVGRNYKAHAEELGNKVPEKPIIFTKPTTSYLWQGHPIKFPPGCNDLHHEVELGIVVGKKGYQIPEEKAKEYIGGYFVALDMTARDLQLDAKKNGHPWTLSKGWDTSTPAGEFIEKDKITNPQNLQIWLKVNGEMRQNGNTADMIFSISYLISFISKYMTLEEGDVILTGTPSGVGGLKGGDVIEAGIGDVAKITFSVDKS